MNTGRPVAGLLDTKAGGGCRGVSHPPIYLPERSGLFPQHARPHLKETQRKASGMFDKRREQLRQVVEAPKQVATLSVIALGVAILALLVAIGGVVKNGS